jgi:ribose transport system permease protein
VPPNTRFRRSIDAFHLTGQGLTGRFAPYRAVSDLVRKPWMEGALPLLLALLLSALVVATTPVGIAQTSSILHQVAQLGFLVIGLTIVMIAGGIDLSIGSIFGVVAIGSLVLDRAFGVPIALVIVLAPIAGAMLGSINGLFIAKLKTRPFITTLVTLLAFRGFVKFIQNRYVSELSFPSSDPLWDFLRRGSVAGVPTGWFIFAAVLAITHLGLTRSRWGWWTASVGSDRRSARRNGIPLDRVVFSTYVISGALAGVAGLMGSARFGRADARVGEGLELVALTAVVLGAVSLKGGRGSVVRATVGMFVVAIIQQASISLRLEAGAFPTILAMALLVFAIVDLKWGQYRERIAEKLSLNPARVSVGPLVDVTKPGTLWTVNNLLSEAPGIGIGTIEGAEDCAIDDQGNMYCGDRRGWIWRFAGPDQQKGEIFARTGGLPLGHAWDREGRLLVCVGGIGVYRIHADGSAEIAAKQVKRSWGLHDDSAIRFADDLDVASDGSLYVSDFSTRTNTAEYMKELVEYRPNGRIIRVDADGSTEVAVSNYVFPNGMCTAHDGQSVLIASTGLFRIDRLWISGPKQGTLDPLLENLPGYPDNINRASDGNYWMSFVAMRTPVADLLMKYPAIRHRMTRELPIDDWIVPQLNVSCVMKFNESGEVLKVLWDGTLERYPMVTSINEHAGYLYLCGVHNNRVGRLKLDAEDLGSIDPRSVPGANEQTAPFGNTPKAAVEARTGTTDIRERG